MKSGVRLAAQDASTAKCPLSSRTPTITSRTPLALSTQTMCQRIRWYPARNQDTAIELSRKGTASPAE